jgi:hypothetical protein
VDPTTETTYEIYKEVSRSLMMTHNIDCFIWLRLCFTTNLLFNITLYVEASFNTHVPKMPCSIHEWSLLPSINEFKYSIKEVTGF